MPIKIGVLTSGGDAPGMNAAIRAITRAGIAEGMEVYAIYDGYKGLVENHIEPLNYHFVSTILNRGGTIIGTARLPEFKQLEVRQKAVENLKRHGINALIVIGGDGTYRGAAELNLLGINTIGLPGTIDNDIASTEFTIGFDTALNTIVENVDKIRDTSSSHQRCSVVEVMGRRCGDLAMWAGLATGAECIVIPEVGLDVDRLVNDLIMIRQKGNKHALVIITEKMVKIDELTKIIQERTGYETRSSVLGHIQRGGAPTAADRVLAMRMGAFAVRLIKEGWTSRCVSVVSNEIVHFDIYEALEKPHQIKLQLLEDAKTMR